MVNVGRLSVLQHWPHDTYRFYLHSLTVSCHNVSVKQINKSYFFVSEQTYSKVDVLIIRHLWGLDD